MDKHQESLKARIDAIPLQDRDGEHVLRLIRASVIRTPELIEDLFPGKRLIPRRMSPQERTQLASKAAAIAAKAAAEERYERVLPIIQQVLLDDPTASLSEIKSVLDNSGVTPLRSLKWSRATINFIMTKAGIRAKN